MILIISNGHDEPTTDYVIDWLVHYKTDFIRINSEDVVDKKNLLSMELGPGKIVIGGQTIIPEKINAVWYRRWYDYRDIDFRPRNVHERQLRREIIEEANDILFYFYHLLREKPWLSNPVTTLVHNKLYTLQMAQQLGLKTPLSYLTNSREGLKTFHSHTGMKLITKPIGDPFVYFDDEGNNYKNYTGEVTAELIGSLPDRIFPSFFQQMVRARCEIRSFYLDGEFYSTAIVNSGTLDIKLSVKRDAEVKFICFSLPPAIRQKLRLLMDQLGLNTGSIDIIQDEEGEYYFLEVNPVGQFSGYGFPCNYQLEKKVAEWLCKADNQKSIYDKGKNRIYEHIQ